MVHNPSMATWKKIKKLGAGSYATVFLAAPEDNSFFVQTPLMAVKSAWDPVGYNSLKKEATFLNEIKGCPCIVRCFGEDTSIENGMRVYNLLLEYAPRGSLHDLIIRNRGNLSETIIAFYSYMILRALSHIHSKGLVHCDIKPANILVFPTTDGIGFLKLADFGLARREAEVETYYCGRLSHNRGTMIYASPESVKQGIHKKAVDIWALGITVIEMITGRRAWSFVDELDLLNQISQSDPEIPTNVSEMGQDFLKSCFIRDPSRRPTADALLRHPFIVNNLLAAKELHRRRVELPCNPFGESAPWISGLGMFSAKLELQQMRYYQLFPCDDARVPVQHRPFDVTCETAMSGLGHHLFAR